MGRTGVGWINYGKKMGLALGWVGGETHDARKSVKPGNPRVQKEGYMRWKVFSRETGADGFGG